MSETLREVIGSSVIGMGPGELVMQNVQLKYQTGDGPWFHDITDDVKGVVEDLGLMIGMVHVFSRHTTAAIRLQENESMLKRDVEAWLERIAPRGHPYGHNDFEVRTENMTPDESPNGHAHIQHMVFGSSETIPVAGGELRLGGWQRVFLIELDRPRTREVALHIFGFGGRRSPDGKRDGNTPAS